MSLSPVPVTCSNCMAKNIGLSLVDVAWFYGSYLFMTLPSIAMMFFRDVGLEHFLKLWESWIIPQPVCVVEVGHKLNGIILAQAHVADSLLTSLMLIDRLMLSRIISHWMLQKHKIWPATPDWGEQCASCFILLAWSDLRFWAVRNVIKGYSEATALSVSSRPLKLRRLSCTQNVRLRWHCVMVDEIGMHMQY